MSFETNEIRDRCKLLTKQGKKPKEIAEHIGPPLTVADVYNLRVEMRKSGELPPLDREEKANTTVRDVPGWLGSLIEEQERLRRRLKLIDEMLSEYEDEIPFPKSLKR